MGAQTDTLRVDFYDSVPEIPAPQWDALAGPNEYALRASMLGAIAISRPKTAVYPAVSTDDAMLAASVVYQTHVATSPSAFVRLDLMVDRIAQDAGLDSGVFGLNAATLMPTASVGAHQQSTERVLRHRGAPGKGPAALNRLFEAIEARAEEWGTATVSVPYVDTHDTQLRKVLSDREYEPFPCSWLAVLQVDWPDFDAYLGTLSGHRRRRILRERRDVADAGIRTAISPLSESDVVAFELLKGNVDAKYHGESARQAPSPNSLLAISAREKIAAPLAATAWIGDRLVGFCQAYHHGEEMTIAQWGVDHDIVGNVPIYFELAYYRMIEYAAANGVRRMHFGPTAYRAKQARGCSFVPSLGYVQARSAAVQEGVRRFTAAIDLDALTSTVLSR